jgi:hypothetical protein
MEEKLGVREHLPSKKLGLSLFPQLQLCIRDETGKEMPWSLDNAKHNEVLVR